VEKLQLTGKVGFFGKRTDCTRFYQMADALVIPSLYDPFANVTLEALALGVFVLSSKNNGGHEVLTAQNGATLSSLDDPELFAQLLTASMKHPKTLVQAQMIRESVKHLDFSHQLNALVDQCLS
jgi:UDP-glucose:(heptosyl)LPS alpha-1,3-glucosyltransferase